MSRIKISGAIVPSDYDCDWMADYIEKGVITPESRFRAQLEQAAKDEPLEIHVNSQGGSVFAGAQMANDVKAWQLENSQPVSVVVGALAASAASTFALEVGAPVSVYENTRFMFHGAVNVAWGGAEHMEDQAALLAKINDSIKHRLVDGYKVDKDKVEDWFSEGRMGWMDAAELIECGIAGEVIDGKADAPAQVTDGDPLLQIAACLRATGEENPETKPETVSEPEPETEPETPDGETIEARLVAIEQKSETLEAELQAANEAVAGLTDELKAANSQTTEQGKIIQKHEATIDRLNAALDAKQSKLDKITETLRDAEQRLARVAPGRLLRAEDNTGVIAWAKAVELSGSYEKARKEYPRSYEQYMKQEKSKG